MSSPNLKPLPLADAQKLAGRLIDALAPACERIEVAGSIRREKTTVGDIEIVAVPSIVLRPLTIRQGALFSPVEETPLERRNLLDESLGWLLEDGKIWRDPPPGLKPAWGDSYKKFWLQSLPGQITQVDLFLATADNWGAIFTIRTGSWDFSKALVTHLKYKTPYRQQEGALVVKETGEVIAVPEEADYFALAGVEWVEPCERTGPKALRTRERD